MSFPKHVFITEVSPRDGLQNEKIFVPTEIKIQLIELLTQAGFPIIETTAFVNPQKIPALADHTAVMKNFQSTTQTKYMALIPNTQGLGNAIAAGCTNISVITAVSETFAQKNMGCSIDDSVQRIADILTITKPQRIPVRAYISCTLSCPYEGIISHEITAQLAKKLFEMGCDEITIADTIGAGTPLIAQQLIQTVNQYVPIEKIAIHFHDTYGQAIANIFACLQIGITKIDASVGGLGGCPYAKGATGNVATEKVLYLLHGLNIETGINADAAKMAGEFIKKYLASS